MNFQIGEYVIYKGDDILDDMGFVILPRGHLVTLFDIEGELAVIGNTTTPVSTIHLSTPVSDLRKPSRAEYAMKRAILSASHDRKSALEEIWQFWVNSGQETAVKTTKDEV